jgi:SAM-dependent methyltransferase
VLGVDRSLAMLDEAVHHQREARVAVDFVRADAGSLPLASSAFGVVVNVGAFHLYEDAGKVLGEVARLLRPGGHLVCGTLLPDVLGVVRRAERRAGVFRRSEEQLRAACEKAGFTSFERLLLPPAILFRVEKPPVSGV